MNAFFPYLSLAIAFAQILASQSVLANPASPAEAASSSFSTGGDLAATCAKGPADNSYFACLGYVHGVFVGYEKVHGDFYCKSQGIGLRDEPIVVAKYAKDHPERLNEPADRWTIEAALNSYPCP